MKLLTKVALTVLVLGTAACTRPDRFGADGAAGANGAMDGASAQAGINDPTSPLYFNQTIGDRVLFEVNSSTLTDQGKSILGGAGPLVADQRGLSGDYRGSCRRARHP